MTMCIICNCYDIVDPRKCKNCKSFYCTTCIESWLAKNKICAVCRCDATLEIFEMCEVERNIPEGFEDKKNEINKYLAIFEKSRELIEQRRMGTKNFDEVHSKSLQTNSEAMHALIKYQSEIKIKELEADDLQLKSVIDELVVIQKKMDEILKKNRSDEECEILLNQITLAVSQGNKIRQNQKNNIEKYIHKFDSNVEKICGDVIDSPGTVLMSVYGGSPPLPSPYAKQSDYLALPALPVSHIMSDVIISDIVPPYMDFEFIIPNFFESVKEVTDCIYSPIYVNPPFPFQWRIIIFPYGSPEMQSKYRNAVCKPSQIETPNKDIKSIEEVQSEKLNLYLRKFGNCYISMGIELVDGLDDDFVNTSLKLFPLPSIPENSVTTSPLLPKLKYIINLAHPAYFEYKLQAVTETTRKRMHRIHTFEGKENFSKKRIFFRDDFMTHEFTLSNEFLWKANLSMHFIMGIRFPTYKRESQALKLLFVKEKNMK